MSIVDRKKNEILKEESLNKSFLSAKLNELNIECKIFKDDFYCDSFNYFPIIETNETFGNLFKREDDNSISNFYTEDFYKNAEEAVRALAEAEDVLETIERHFGE